MQICPRSTVRVTFFGTSSQLNTLQGDVICLRVFSRVVVVLCSLSAVKDLLEKRGETYSDRPSFPVIEMYVLWHPYFPIGRQVDNPRRTEMDWPLFTARMSETWREGRKLLDRSLRPGAVMSYRQTVQEKTREFLAQLSANPKDFLSHAKRSVSRLLHMA
jgi:cytochrome P450